MRLASTLALIAALTLAPPLSAQVTPGIPMPGMNEIGGLMEMARQQMNPAAAVLARRAELGLTPAQVAALDSVAAPLNVIIDRMMTPEPGMMPIQMEMAQAMADPSAPLDEPRVRAMLLAQAERQVDLTMESFKAQRRLLQILTAEQRDRWMSLQMEAAARMMGAMGGMVTPGQ